MNKNNKTEKIICPNCHNKINKVDNFCPVCGKKLHKKFKIHKNIEIVLSPKNLTIISLGLLVFIVIMLWLIGVIPICGDNFCSSKECFLGCDDCNPEKCLDNICQPQIFENCDNSNDCGCDVHETCAIDRNNTDDKGCYVITCGDEFCDSKKEDVTNCCLDCDCVSGYTCNIEKNECQFESPKLSIDNYNVTNSISASTIYSNKELINDEGESHPLLKFKFKNTGVNIAKNILVKIKLSYYTEEDSFSFEDLDPFSINTVEWYPTANNNILSIKETKDYLITVTFIFQDEYGKDYELTETIPIEILGRNNWDWKFSSWSQFVTPQDPLIREAVSSAGSFSTQTPEGIRYAAQKIWNFLNGLDIDYISDPNKEYIQYPAEVLNNKKGDCDDLAILYATMLESIGIQSAVIERPGHLFTAYFDGTYIYPVEATLIGSSFNEALNSGSNQYEEYEDVRKIINIEQEWNEKNINPPSNVGVSKINFPSITVGVAADGKWSCEEGVYSCDLWKLKINCDYNFVNNGNAEGEKCITAQVYKDGNIVKTENICQTVASNEHKEKRISYSEYDDRTYEFTYYCDYI